MKKFLALFLLLTSCQSADYNSGTTLYMDGSAMECIFDARTQTAHEYDCENLGKTRLFGQVGPTAELQPLSNISLDKVYLVFEENGKDLGVAKSEMDSYLNTAGWFELRIYFFDKENIYVWNRSGEEFISGTLNFYNGSDWKDLEIEEKVREALPEEFASEELTIRDILISEDEISVSATIGDDIQYLELVNYVMNFDAATMELLDLDETTKPL